MTAETTTRKEQQMRYEFKQEKSVPIGGLSVFLTEQSAEGWEIVKLMSPKEQVGTDTWFVLLRKPVSTKAATSMSTGIKGSDVSSLPKPTKRPLTRTKGKKRGR
ncbi:MAG: hypothetical protein JRI80_00065 [Deltaproteobacteria bacterium]|nr:hypothetical protein [Deltaproteobacteria bacterium]